MSLTVFVSLLCVSDSLPVSLSVSQVSMGKRVWCTSSDFLGLQDAKCHVILIIGMATHCLECGSHKQQQQCGHICAAGALSHEK